MNPNRKNLANGILALGVSTSDTTWVLESGYGGAMPAVPFFLTITPFGQLSTMGNSEIVNVTARTADTLTVQRGAKGTTAKAFAAGAVVSNGVYVEDKVGSANIDFTTLGFGNYSTSEVDTGFKWINGNAIYKKTVYAATLIAGWQQLAHGISGFSLCIDAYGVLTTDKGIQQVPRIVPDGVATYSIGVGDFTATNFAIIIGSAYTSRTNMYLTILYTKTS